MPELISCPTCGSSNPAGAQWCGQCFTSFAAEEEPAPAEVGLPAPTRSGWECRSCQHINDVADSVCAVCGTSIFDSYGATADAVYRDPEVALRRAIVFPGFGYSALGLGGVGAVVGFLAVACAVVGVMLLASGELVGLVLVATFGGLWAVSVFDVVQLARGGATSMLRPRVLSIIGGAVVGLLLLTVLVAFQEVTG